MAQITIAESMLLETVCKPDIEKDFIILTESEIAEKCDENNSRSCAHNNTVIRMFGEALAKFGFEKRTFIAPNSKRLQIGWKVKLVEKG